MELRGTSDKQDDGSFEPVEASAEEGEEVRHQVKNRSLKNRRLRHPAADFGGWAVALSW
jgi:hypothetical protein